MHQQVGAARHARAQSQEAGRRRVTKIQIAIRVVLDQDGVVAHSNLQQTLATGQPEHAATGVAKGGDQVNELGAVLHDEALQAVHVDALFVQRRADQLGTVQTEALDGGQESGAFDDDLVAGADQGLAQQVQRLLAARGHDQLLGGQGRALAVHESGDLLAQRAVTFGGTVLQGRTWLLRQGGQARFANAVDVEQGAVGETARKTDDAGLAQQLEQLADGGGFNVVQTIGKRDSHATQSKT